MKILVNFFKPTRFKVILTLAIIFTWFMVQIFGWFTYYYLLSHPSPPPTPLYGEDIYPRGLRLDQTDLIEVAPLVSSVIFSIILSLLVLLLPFYLITCSIIAIFGKLRKKLFLILNTRLILTLSEPACLNNISAL
jgi:hypothetical protein